jgi:hypothetical protein
MIDQQEVFDETYFSSGAYENYLSRGLRYKKMAEELMGLFDKLNINSSNNGLLDFGCGPGLFVKGLTKLGYSVHGYDVSDWAVEHAITSGLDVFDTFKALHDRYGITFALDVFEHMADKDIERFFFEVESNYLVVRIPVCDAQHRFIDPLSRLDSTHINKKTKGVWKAFLTSFEYTQLFKLNLVSIYDSVGVYCAVFKKNDII